MARSPRPNRMPSPPAFRTQWRPSGPRCRRAWSSFRASSRTASSPRMRSTSCLLMIRCGWRSTASPTTVRSPSTSYAVSARASAPVTTVAVRAASGPSTRRAAARTADPPTSQSRRRGSSPGPPGFSLSCAAPPWRPLARAGGDQALVPASAALGDPTLVVEVDPNQSEALAVTQAPLEVVEQRPDEVAAQVDAGGEGVRRCRDVPREVADAIVVDHLAAGVAPVGVCGAVLGDDDLGRRVLVLQPGQAGGQALWHDLPVHLRQLDPGARLDPPVEGRVRIGADRLLAVVVDAQVIQPTRPRIAHLHALEVARGTMLFDAQPWIAAAEERAEEPGVARRAVGICGALGAPGVGRGREVVDVHCH